MCFTVLFKGFEADCIEQVTTILHQTFAGKL